MTNCLRKPQAGNVVKLSGQIIGYRCPRASASFVYSQGDQHAISVVEISAELAGMSGPAASVAGFASDVEESAEYLNFDLDGAPVRGWVWRSPFKEGDMVDVAAEWQGDHYEAYGIARPSDKIIALYPHCSRTKRRHIKNAVKLWLIWNTVFFGFSAMTTSLLLGFDMLREPAFFSIGGVIAVMWVLMFISLSKQYMPFVRLSEKVFSVLGLPDASNLDLVKSSKQQRTAEDPPEFGTFYFRY